MTIVLLKLLAKCTGVANLMEYVEDVIGARREEEKLFLLPPLIDHNRSMQNVDINLPHLLLDKLHLAELLQKSEMEYNRVKTANPYSLNAQDMTQHRHSWVEPNTRSSINDNSNMNDTESIGSSPGVVKVG